MTNHKAAETRKKTSVFQRKVGEATIIAATPRRNAMFLSRSDHGSLRNGVAAIARMTTAAPAKNESPDAK
jgi:hypothetical protein